jgi:hypothetical protein
LFACRFDSCKCQHVSNAPTPGSPPTPGPAGVQVAIVVDAATRANLPDICAAGD